MLVGLPPEPLEVGAFKVAMGRRSFAGSNIGGIAETQEVLDFCLKHKITADIEIINMQEVTNTFKRPEKATLNTAL